MEILHICPQCGIPAIHVGEKVVLFYIKTADSLPTGKKWSACPNSECEIAYFTKGYDIYQKDLTVKLFYKRGDIDVPICYCSNLKRGEIHEAVKAGCLSIDQVQEYTGKDITGYCEEKNPLGKCCRNAFLFEIRKAVSQINNDLSNTLSK
ncbi:MAG: (2Fe-2S)-binding protein [Bacteroidales bacterium]|nr:(2Fe-2S)-binding protein [Bacteroidales bacterium]